MKNLAAALCKAQGQMSGALKDSTNPAFKSKYADLSSVWEAIRRPLADNGLSVTQQTDLAENGEMMLLTTLWHTSGESIAARYPLRPVQATPQAYGSCLSYARRYSLSALLGVVQADDDGNEASGKSSPPPGPPDAAPTAPPPKPAAKKLAPGGAGGADGSSAAEAWARQAARALQELTTGVAIDAWLATNADRLEKLQKVSPALYDSVMSIATTTHELVTRRNEAAE
jgi:hypothetical protein